MSKIMNVWSGSMRVDVPVSLETSAPDLVRATAEAFRVMSELRSAAAPPEQLRRGARRAIERAAAAVARAGAASVDVQAVAYALSALADEIALAESSPLRDRWSPPLMRGGYFDDELAGENFFRYLDALRRDPRKAPVVRVYYTCLLFGFRGRYRVQGAELAYTDYVDGLRRELARIYPSPATLSPETLEPPGSFRNERAGMRLPWLAIGIAALCLGVYACGLVVLDRIVTDVAAQLERAGRG